MAEGIRFPDDMVGKGSPLHDDDKVLLSDSQDAKKAKWWSLSVIKSWLYGFFAKINGDNVTDANKTAWQGQLEIALLNDQLKNGVGQDVHTLTENGVYATDATTTNLPVGISKIGVLNIIISGTSKYLNYTTYESGSFNRWSQFYDGATWSIWQALETELGESKQNISTGLLYGGELSINTDPTKFDVASGKGVIVNSYTNPTTPTITPVSWVLQEAISVDDIATQLVTWVYVDSAGTFYQSGEPLTSEESRNLIQIGILVHSDLASISKATTIPNWASDSDLKISDLSSSLGSRIITEGNKITPNGANLKIDKSIGKTFGIGVNYDINKKDPNVRMDAHESAITFLTAKGGTPSGIGSSSDIDTIYYDPNGAGVLVEIPDEFVSVHGVFFSSDTGITIVHYGQFIYDSIREAIDAWDKQEYNVIPELEGVALAGVIAFVKGATDLSDHTQAMFVKTGKLGIGSNNTVEEYSRFSSISKTLSGMTYNRPSITFRESGGNVYADVERLGGGDMIFIFGEREYILNCTTGAGIGGKATILLTDGSDTVPQKNYIYATPTIGNGHAILNSSTSRPSGTFGYVADCLIQASGSGFTANGPLQSRRWTDAKEFDGRGVLSRTNERFRVLPAEWESPGILQSVIIDSGVSPYSVNLTFTAGKVWQKHLQDFPFIDISTDGIYISNHPTAPYTQIFDLNDVEALQTSSGDSLSDTRFNWVFAGVINMETGQCKALLTLPIDSYSTDDGAVSDGNRTAVTSFNPDFKGNVFLIARLPMRHRSISGGTYENLALSKLGTAVVDLRGQNANTSGGASSPPIGSSFEDVLFNIYNAIGGFQFRFDASNLTANRINSLQDKTGTIAHLEDIIDVQIITVLAMGQSNMCGHFPGGNNDINTNVEVWNGSTWAVASLLTTPFIEQDLFGTAPNGNQSFYFAKRLQKETGAKVRILTSFHTGQPISYWTPATGIGYQDMLTKVSASSTTEVDIVLWDHGEANRTDLIATYAGYFNNLLAQLRGETFINANVPIICAQMADGTIYDTQNAFYNDIYTYVNDEYVGVSQTSELPVDGGVNDTFAIHYTGASQFIIGDERHWKTYESLPIDFRNARRDYLNTFEKIQIFNESIYLLSGKLLHFDAGVTNDYSIEKSGLRLFLKAAGSVAMSLGAGNVAINGNSVESGTVLDVNGLAALGTTGSPRIYAGTLDASTAYIQARDTVAKALKIYASEFELHTSALRMTIQAGGAVVFGGTVTATNFILSSDIRLKEDIKPVKTKSIDSVELRQFTFKADASKRTRYGVIAQDLEKTHPEMVHTDEKGYKQVDYIDFLLSKIASLEARLLKLEK